MEEEALVKTALSYVRLECCLKTAMFPDVPFKFIHSFANRGRFGYKAGASVTKMQIFAAVVGSRRCFPDVTCRLLLLRLSMRACLLLLGDCRCVRATGGRGRV